ncbi:uncharacterized protein [Temnothorax nylanderi]|uniref:uncharacterized protein n=1 Tax=Temnothorax nylanderi TaxID=102681 RepID=UPI003A858FB4
MAKLDLKDAYFLVPVHQQDRKFSRFLFRGSSQRECQVNVQTTCSLLLKLGFIINREKSQLIPATRCEYLGFVLNSERFTLDLPDRKRLATKNMIERFQPETRCTIKEFASLIGWGAVWKGNSTGYLWSADERTNHINFLELLAISLALKCFAQNLSNCEILLRVDNTTAISYINRMRGTKVPKLNRLVREIWQWCESKSLWLFASYIPSKENTEADRESRYTDIDTEWELADYAFNHLVARLGKPEIDLFASRINAKCKDYCSWRRDPCALAVDAFTIS